MENASVARPTPPAPAAYGPAPGAPDAPSAGAQGAPPAPDAPAADDLDPLGGLDEVEELLRGDPTSFEFFQAVRLLSRLRPGREPVGRFARPTAEAVRFSVNPATAFPASEIQALSLPPDAPGEQGLPRVTVNFMGLIGPLGVLPTVYGSHAADRARVHDTALRDFLDLFHHRIISLFYRAWEKYRFTVTREQGADDVLTGHLRDLTGIGTGGLQGRLPVSDGALLSHAGLLGIRPRPAAALEQLVGDYFDVPVAVEQFVGGWYPLAVATQCRVDDEGEDASGQLGLGAVVGDEIWDLQSRVRIRVGPLPRPRYEQFLPGGSAYEPLRALVHFFGNGQFDFDLQLVLARDDVPGLVLGADGDEPPLAWCTWLRSAQFSRDPDDTILEL
jgi:type VI secretion system protein ImpH